MITEFEIFESNHPHPEKLLCIKESKPDSKYVFTINKEYLSFVARGSGWYGVWECYDELVIRSDNDIKWINVFLLQPTAHIPEYKYYYEDGGALFTTETPEAYNKRKRTEQFDL